MNLQRLILTLLTAIGIAATSWAADSGFVPDIKLAPRNPDRECSTQFLFDRYTDMLFVSPTGSPVPFIADSLGVEENVGVRSVTARTHYFYVVKKGNTYYDPVTDSSHTADRDLEVISEEAWPYGEIYNFDRSGRLVSHYYGSWTDCNDEDATVFDYRPDGTFTYSYEHRETDDFPPLKISGKWDGTTWTETLTDRDETARRFNAPVTYTLRPLAGHPGYFTIAQEGDELPCEIRYRMPDGTLSRALTPGLPIAEQSPHQYAKPTAERTKPDAHGNALTVRGSDSIGSTYETVLEITYY